MLPRASGIYKIVNLSNGKIYVGSSVDIRHRWSSHRSLLRKSSHHSLYLQAAWNKHGEESFAVEVIELCSLDQLLVKEQEYIDKLSVLNRNIGYNLSPTAGATTGLLFTEEQRGKMSEVLRKRYEDPEERLKTTIATIAATSDPDYRKECSERTRVKWLDPEFRQKHKSGMVGSISDTARRNQAQRMREKFEDPSNREALALNIPHRKRVRCRENGTIYDSVSKAVRETGVSIQSVKNDLRGKTDFKTVRRKFTFEVCNE